MQATQERSLFSTESEYLFAEEVGLVFANKSIN